MSEHDRPVPERHDTPLTPAPLLRSGGEGSHSSPLSPASGERGRGEGEENERTPGVSHESEAFDFRLILWVGAGLVVTAVVVQVVVWWLFRGVEKIDAVPAGGVSELALEEANKPLAQRLDDVPAPHLEGIERESSLLVVRTERGEEKRFYAASDIRVRIGENKKARLFELREGQRVTVCYYEPGGVGGGLGVVTSLTSPQSRGQQELSQTELPDASRTLDCEILKIEPRSIAAAREWAEVQMKQYGWIDREKEIVHVPIERAMEEVLRSKEFRAEKKKR
ncbi:MAG: hypothetical protein ACYC3I_09405 [Gemmataceae bacterium]